MTSKYTPAPWEVHDGGYNVVANDVVLFINGFGADDSELEPNAKLIAAAPDLLEALIAMLDSPYDVLSAELWDKAREAIAKATQ